MMSLLIELHLLEVRREENEIKTTTNEDIPLLLTDLKGRKLNTNFFLKKLTIKLKDLDILCLKVSQLTEGLKI